MSIRHTIAFPALLVAMLVLPAAAQPPAGAGSPAANEPATAAGREDNDEGTIDLTTLIAQVAARENREFLVDPRVRARVRIIPPIEQPDFGVLLSVLRVHGYAAVEVEGRIQIVPDGLARWLPTRVLQRDDNSVSDDEIVTRVLSVPSGQAPQLVPVLRPMLPQNAHLAATADNRLIIVDRYDNVRRITEVVGILTR
jgi:general secretion pathway protein D